MIHLFEQFINEGKQVGTLYHYTKLDYLYKILKNNELNLSSGIEAFDFDKQLSYKYISFTRNKNFHVHGGNEKIENGVTGIECRIIIDGNKLSNKFKIEPFDYYPGQKLKSTQFEAEERIIFDVDKKEPIIKDLDKYVVSYEIFSNSFNDTNLVDKCLKINKKVVVC